MQRSNVDSWFFGCLGAVFLILAALATPEVARADGGECEPDPITYCNNKCGVDGQCYKECIDTCNGLVGCRKPASCENGCSKQLEGMCSLGQGNGCKQTDEVNDCGNCGCVANDTAPPDCICKKS